MGTTVLHVPSFAPRKKELIALIVSFGTRSLTTLAYVTFFIFNSENYTIRTNTYGTSGKKYKQLRNCFIIFFLTPLVVPRRYFEEEDEQQHSRLEYIPAPDSPSNRQTSDADSDSSEDPLDAFMEDLEKEV